MKKFIVYSFLFFPFIYTLETRDKICNETECVRISSFFKGNMNLSVNPCQDFYQFACGNFENNADIPKDESVVNILSSHEKLLNENLKTLLEEPVIETDFKPYSLAKQLYTSCVNISNRDQDNLNIMHTLIAAVGGWPVLDGNLWNATNFDWKEFSYRANDRGYNTDYLIKFSIAIDDRNTSRYIIKVEQPSFGLQRGYLVKGFHDNMVQFYYNYIVDVAVLHGANRTQARQEIKEAVLFEIQLAKISLSNERRRYLASLYSTMTLKEFKDYTSTNVDWVEYINHFLLNIENVTHKESIVIIDKLYFKFLDLLLTQTQKRVLANYMMWKIVSEFSPLLSESIRNRRFQLTKMFSGQIEIKPRWKECIHIVKHYLPIALEALYVRKYNKETLNNNINDIITHIKEEMKEKIKYSSWMDKSTKSKANIKLESITYTIGFPSEIFDNNKLLDYYKYVNFDVILYIIKISAIILTYHKTLKLILFYLPFF